MSANRPDISQIRKYLNGELNARAMHRLERQALDDPFLMDALQGYERSKPDQQPHLNDLQRRLQQRINKRDRKVVALWPLITVAASVLVFVAVGGWWLLHDRETTTQVAVHARLIPAPKSPSVLSEQKAPAAEQMVIKRAPPKTAEKNTTSDSEVPSAGDRLAANTVTVEPEIDKKVVLREVTVKNVPSSVLKEDTMAVGNQIRIRGTSAVAGQQPLMVVDGVPVRTMPGLKADDIATIQVLKDSSSKALYGSRAANGVILVTTKKGASALAAVAAKPDTNHMLSELPVAAAAPAQALEGRVAGVQVSNYKSKNLDTLNIAGQIIDKDSKEPLPGVTVKVKGASTGAVTDVQGRFKLTGITKDKTLTLSYVGYETQEIKVKGNDLKIALEPNSRSLSEVVVTGYGAQKVEIDEAHPAIGWNEYNKYLQSHAEPKEKEGVVRVKFTVNTDNTLTGFKVTKSFSSEADQEAIDLIKNGPQWIHNVSGNAETVTVRVRFKKK